MQCIAILWNSMNEYFSEAIHDIEQKAIIDDAIYVNFEDYYSFIKDIYDYDVDKAGFSEYKASIMVDQYDSNMICILYLTLPESQKKYIERKKEYIFENIEELKTSIRGKYKQIVENYQFDNVFHMTDDDEEYNYVNEIISKHLSHHIKNKTRSLKK